jgi:hypothetical protein
VTFGIATWPRLDPLRRWYRPVASSLTTVILALVVLELAYGLFGPLNWRAAIGNDLAFYARISARLFSGGHWYEDRELHGPFDFDYRYDVLYPPAAAWIFLPFNILGIAGLLAIAAATVIWLLREWRPAPWTWPLMALCLLWPLTLLKGLAGTSSLFVMVGVGLGLRYSWPAAFVMLKPSFLPLSLIGSWRRSWWLAVLAIAVASLPFLADTLRYPEVILNMRNPRGSLYSLDDLPLILLPIIAWLGRTRPAIDHPVGSTDSRFTT